MDCVIYYTILTLKCSTCVYAGSNKKSDTDGDIKEFVLSSHNYKTSSVFIKKSAESISSKRVKAAFVILCRNSDISGLAKTLPQLEMRFNKTFNYPYVFLNDKPFTKEFKAAVQKLSPSPMTFGLIPEEHWSIPDWIDKEKAREAREDMQKRDIIYGGSLPYRHMCRFNSGFFYRHELLKDFDYYWRVEPDVNFHCDINYDPFLWMKENKKKYGFTIMLNEYMETIPTLWEKTKQFIKKNPEMIPAQNSMKIFSPDYESDKKGKYNGCHFWSNFEIADLNFLRSPQYSAYFDHLDNEGGFFMERWGDAPVHSIAAGMFLRPDELHHFEDIGYYHGPFTNCPVNPALSIACDCKPKDNTNSKCLRRYQMVSRGTLPEGA